MASLITDKIQWEMQDQSDDIRIDIVVGNKSIAFSILPNQAEEIANCLIRLAKQNRESYKENMDLVKK